MSERGITETNLTWEQTVAELTRRAESVAEEMTRAITRAASSNKILQYDQQEVIATLQRWRSILRGAK